MPTTTSTSPIPAIGGLVTNSSTSRPPTDGRLAGPASGTTTPTPATSCSARSSSAPPGDPCPRRSAASSVSGASGSRDTYWETLEPTPPDAKPRAHQYYDDFDNITLDASHDLYGGGGLVSTVSDLTRFYRALFHGRIFHRRQTLRAMLHVSAPGRRAGAAMGIFRVDVDGERCFGHPGYWGTETIHCPRLDLTIARTTNQADDSDFDSGPLERVAADLARRAVR